MARDYGASEKVTLKGLPGGTIRQVVVWRGHPKARDTVTVHYLDGTRRRLVTGAAAGVSLAEHVVYEDAGRPERRGRGGPEE